LRRENKSAKLRNPPKKKAKFKSTVKKKERKLRIHKHTHPRSSKVNVKKELGEMQTKPNQTILKQQQLAPKFSPQLS
jgi:hypothetical protein